MVYSLRSTLHTCTLRAYKHKRIMFACIRMCGCAYAEEATERVAVLSIEHLSLSPALCISELGLHHGYVVDWCAHVCACARYNICVI